MIIVIRTVTDVGYISLCRFLVYKLSLSARKRALAKRHKSHAFKLLSKDMPGYKIIKCGILKPVKFTYNPTFIVVYKQDSARR